MLGLVLDPGGHQYLCRNGPYSRVKHRPQEDSNRDFWKVEVLEVHVSEGM